MKTEFSNEKGHHQYKYFYGAPSLIAETMDRVAEAYAAGAPAAGAGPGAETSAAEAATD